MHSIDKCYHFFSSLYSFSFELCTLYNAVQYVHWSVSVRCASFALLLFIFRDRKDWWLRHTQTHTTLSLTQTSNERQQHSTKMDFLLATEHGKYIKPTSCKWFVHFISFHQFSFVVRCFFGALFSIWQMNLAMSVVVLCTQNHCMCVKEQFNWNECKENKKKVNSKIRRRNNTQEKKSKKKCTKRLILSSTCNVYRIICS